MYGMLIINIFLVTSNVWYVNYKYILSLVFCVLRVRATDHQCRQMQRNIQFGAKNINLATTIGERKITGESFCLALNVTSGYKSLPRAA